LFQINDVDIRSRNRTRVRASLGLCLGSEVGRTLIPRSTQSHRGKRPRFMAQPPLLPKGEFDPASPPSPVQIAIRQACGLAL